jgi:ribonuclease HI
MELRAVLELLRASDPKVPLVVQSDSAYVIGVFTQWLSDWRRNGMRTASRKPIGNVDLVERIAEELERRTVTFEKVQGHAGHELNERADELAQMAARHAAEVVAAASSWSGRRG